MFVCTLDLGLDALRPVSFIFHNFISKKILTRFFAVFTSWILEIYHTAISWATIVTTSMLDPVVVVIFECPTAICSINWISAAIVSCEIFTINTALCGWIFFIWLLGEVDVFVSYDKFETIWTASNIIQVGSFHCIRKIRQISTSWFNEDEVSWNTTILFKIRNKSFANLWVINYDQFENWCENKNWYHSLVCASNCFWSLQLRSLNCSCGAIKLIRLFFGFSNVRKFISIMKESQIRW